MQGDWGSPDIRYFQFNIGKCHNDNKMKDPSVTCYDETKINNFIDNLKVYLYIV